MLQLPLLHETLRSRVTVRAFDDSRSAFILLAFLIRLCWGQVGRQLEWLVWWIRLCCSALLHYSYTSLPILTRPRRLLRHFRISARTTRQEQTVHRGNRRRMLGCSSCCKRAGGRSGITVRRGSWGSALLAHDFFIHCRRESILLSLYTTTLHLVNPSSEPGTSNCAPSPLPVFDDRRLSASPTAHCRYLLRRGLTAASSPSQPATPALELGFRPRQRPSFNFRSSQRLSPFPPSSLA